MGERLRGLKSQLDSPEDLKKGNQADILQATCGDKTDRCNNLQSYYFLIEI